MSCRKQNTCRRFWNMRAELRHRGCMPRKSTCWGWQTCNSVAENTELRTKLHALFKHYTCRLLEATETTRALVLVVMGGPQGDWVAARDRGLYRLGIPLVQTFSLPLCLQGISSAYVSSCVKTRIHWFQVNVMILEAEKSRVIGTRIGLDLPSNYVLSHELVKRFSA